MSLEHSVSVQLKFTTTDGVKELPAGGFQVWSCSLLKDFPPAWRRNPSGDIRNGPAAHERISVPLHAQSSMHSFLSPIEFFSTLLPPPLAAFSSRFPNNFWGNWQRELQMVIIWLRGNGQLVMNVSQLSSAWNAVVWLWPSEMLCKLLKKKPFLRLL